MRGLGSDDATLGAGGNVGRLPHSESYNIRLHFQPQRDLKSGRDDGHSGIQGDLSGGAGACAPHGRLGNRHAPRRADWEVLNT